MTDFADRARGRGTARENWGPAFEAAWNSAAEVGTDVFVPAGTDPVRLREERGGYGPALDLVQPGRYRPVRLLGATTSARISGGRMESVYGVARVHGTGDFPARGTQIQGPSVDSDSLRAPAIELQRSEGALVSGISFYQTGTPHPHVLLHPQSAATTMFAIGTDGEAPLRIVDRSRGLSWVGGPA